MQFFSRIDGCAAIDVFLIKQFKLKAATSLPNILGVTPGYAFMFEGNGERNDQE